MTLAVSSLRLSAECACLLLLHRALVPGAARLRLTQVSASRIRRREKLFPTLQSTSFLLLIVICSDQVKSK